MMLLAVSFVLLLAINILPVLKRETHLCGKNMSMKRNLGMLPIMATLELVETTQIRKIDRSVALEV